MEYFEHLQPKSGYLNHFGAMVLDVWDEPPLDLSLFSKTFSPGLFH